ncbi:DUF4352 domain-containing protein [Microbispora sp. ATCC PTA-5024]|uniref:DUF4352 domain-containing protein n=1 Tax=Microbispora sp. ATCC PTA-5024 TaxID=316330 RepID=UPI0003DD2C15|nr:DUF4352 domain-containing protein [Microbispora sp. ATCC PTA-5024]ETK33064.1 hypothetical protein MPTA5024_26670 [Microbispora sp. ATCC PTA-5024]
MTVTHAGTRTEDRAEQAPRAGRGVTRRLVAGMAGLALAAAAVYAQTFTLPYEQRGSALTYQGRIGGTVETSRFSVKVTSVTSARAVDTTDLGNKTVKVGTSNLFLLVDVSATTPSEPMQLSELTPPVLLTADGRRYQPTDKVDKTLTLFNKWIQPGFWSAGLLVFEVPKDAIPGARLVFVPPDSLMVSDSFAPEAQIDLGLSGATATRLVSQPEDFHSLTGKS